MVKMHHSEPSKNLHSISDQVTKDIMEALIDDNKIKSSGNVSFHLELITNQLFFQSFNLLSRSF